MKKNKDYNINCYPEHERAKKPPQTQAGQGSLCMHISVIFQHLFIINT